MPPSKRTRPVPLVDRLMPCELSVTRPLMSTVPPSRLVTSTERAVGAGGGERGADGDVGAVVVDVEGAGGGGDRAAVDGERAGPGDVGQQDAVGGAAAALVTVLKVTPAAPMVTPLRLIPVPVPVKLVIWLAALVAVIVPPPLAVNVVPAGPLPARLIGPVKAIVAPVLLVRVAPALVRRSGDRTAEGDGAAGAVGDVDGVAGVAGDVGGDGDVAAGGTGERDAGGVALDELVGADRRRGDRRAGDAGGAGGAGDTGVDALDVDAVGQGDADAADGAVEMFGLVGPRCCRGGGDERVDGGVARRAAGVDGEPERFTPQPLVGLQARCRRCSR